MKVGDMVRFKNVEKRTGVLLEYGTFSDGWWSILASDGMMVDWPETQLEVINEIT
jgi:hypothetical protein